MTIVFLENIYSLLKVVIEWYVINSGYDEEDFTITQIYNIKINKYDAVSKLSYREILKYIEHILDLSNSFVKSYNLHCFFDIFTKKDILPNKNFIIDKIENLFTFAISIGAIQNNPNETSSCFSFMNKIMNQDL